MKTQENRLNFLSFSSLFNFKKIKSKVYPMFRYPINKFVYGQGLGILFRSVKSLALLTYHRRACVLRKQASKPVN